MRRDFKALLRLIETHAILHQCSRARDADGRIVASPEAYFTMRALVADLMASGVGATVPDTIRATVQAVQRLDRGEGAMVRQVAQELKLDRSAAQRRLQGARERGYLINLEEKHGRPAHYAIGESLPDELELLPKTLPGCAHRTPQTDTPVHNVSHSDAEPFKVGVHLCSDSPEKYREEVIDLAD